MKICEIWVKTKTKQKREIYEAAVKMVKKCYGVNIQPDHYQHTFRHNGIYNTQVWFAGFDF